MRLENKDNLPKKICPVIPNIEDEINDETG